MRRGERVCLCSVQICIVLCLGAGVSFAQSYDHRAATIAATLLPEGETRQVVALTDEMREEATKLQGILSEINLYFNDRYKHLLSFISRDAERIYGRDVPEVRAIARMVSEVSVTINHMWRWYPLVENALLVNRQPEDLLIAEEQVLARIGIAYVQSYEEEHLRLVDELVTTVRETLSLTDEYAETIDAYEKAMVHFFRELREQVRGLSQYHAFSQSDHAVLQAREAVLEAAEQLENGRRSAEMNVRIAKHFFAEARAIVYDYLSEEEQRATPLHERVSMLPDAARFQVTRALSYAIRFAESAVQRAVLAGEEVDVSEIIPIFVMANTVSSERSPAIDEFIMYLEDVLFLSEEDIPQLEQLLGAVARESLRVQEFFLSERSDNMLFETARSLQILLLGRSDDDVMRMSHAVDIFVENMRFLFGRINARMIAQKQGVYHSQWPMVRMHETILVKRYVEDMRSLEEDMRALDDAALMQIYHDMMCLLVVKSGESADAMLSYQSC